MDDSSHSDYYFSSLSCSLSLISSFDVSNHLTCQQLFSLIAMTHDLNMLRQEVNNV